jgi:hypothetical protein
MIVYANRKRTVRTRSCHDNWRDALIHFGEVEAAIADTLCPERDAPDPLLERLRSIAVRLAGCDLSALDDLPCLPAEVCVSIPEGYAYYAVYPEDYAKAALRFWREVGPRKATVIGIRSIGTSLSAVVAATLERAGCEVRSFTVRPRGHPFDRRVAVSGFSCDPESHFLIVDEGPGLSGSSFASAASYLSEVGVPDNRIVFFPSWETDGQNLISASARQRWGRHQKYTECRDPWPGCLDLSAGRWRQFSPVAPPVQPQHERRKYLRDRCLFKFEGLGEYGEAKFARAQILADAGFTPHPLSLEDGYLGSEWLTGQPVLAGDARIANWVCRYLHFLEAHFPSDRPVPFDENVEMIHVNVREGLGPEWVGRLDSLERFRSVLCDRRTVEIDGRMLPYEFLYTSGGYVKTDTLDHHDDHFFPGCQDIAWDFAGAAVEFSLDQITDGIPAPCIAFYKVAYLSYRMAYCLMAAESGSDGERFRALAASYAETLRHELDCLR